MKSLFILVITFSAWSATAFADGLCSFLQPAGAEARQDLYRGILRGGKPGAVLGPGEGLATLLALAVGRYYPRELNVCTPVQRAWDTAFQQLNAGHPYTWLTSEFKGFLLIDGRAICGRNPESECYQYTNFYTNAVGGSGSFSQCACRESEGWRLYDIPSFDGSGAE